MELCLCHHHCHGGPPPKVACDEAGSLMELCLCHCRGGAPPLLAGWPPLAWECDGWLGRLAFTLTKRTCFELSMKVMKRSVEASRKKDCIWSWDWLAFHWTSVNTSFSELGTKMHGGSLYLWRNALGGKGYWRYCLHHGSRGNWLRCIPVRQIKVVLSEKRKNSFFGARAWKPSGLM